MSFQNKKGEQKGAEVVFTLTVLRSVDIYMISRNVVHRERMSSVETRSGMTSEQAEKPERKKKKKRAPAEGVNNFGNSGSTHRVWRNSTTGAESSSQRSGFQWQM